VAGSKRATGTTQQDEESRLPLGLMNATFAATESFDGPTPPDNGGRTATQVGAGAFEARKRFAGFTDDDAALLAELRPLFEAHADEIVDAFYVHLRAHEPLRAMVEDPAVAERLHGYQRQYLLSLVGGTYGAAYAESRLRIGHTHNRIGLDPEWYIGTYGHYLDLLVPRIQERFAGDAQRAAQASAALSKLMLIDIQLVLDAYYGLRQQKAVERSAHLAAVGELAASIAHEVRNPLAGMKGALEVLRKELAVKPDNLEIVDELLAQIVRLENLVRDLLNFARPRALTRRLFDLHETLDRVLRMFKEQSDSARITVRRTYEPGTSQLLADATQLEQVFLNLVHNAIQAMEHGGTLFVNARVREGSIVISFRDTGKGIAAGDLPRIFQPFFTTKHRGSGLGLSIVQKIVEAHGGSVEIRSRASKGTTATVSIPH